MADTIVPLPGPHPKPQFSVWLVILMSKFKIAGNVGAQTCEMQVHKNEIGHLASSTFQRNVQQN